MKKDKYLRETVTQLLTNRGLEQFATEGNLRYYIAKAKEPPYGGNLYLTALNVVDLIIFNEGPVAGRRIPLLSPDDTLNVA